MQFPSNVQHKVHHDFSIQLLGFASVLLGCCLSGLSGVYFEKILKAQFKSSDPELPKVRETSVFERNIQLSLFGCLFSLVFGIIIKDGTGISRDGIWVGFNHVIFIVVIFQAIGGTFDFDVRIDCGCSSQICR